MRAAFLILALSGCNLGPQPITPTEARGLAMLHDLRALDPLPACCASGERPHRRPCSEAAPALRHLRQSATH